MHLGRRHAIAGALALALLAASSATVRAFTLSEGDVVISESGIPKVLHALDPVSGASRGTCDCTVCNTLRDLATFDGRIYATAQIEFPGPSFEVGVVEIDPADCGERVVTSGGMLVDIQGIAFEDDGTILLSDDECVGCDTQSVGFNAGGIVRIDRSSGAQTLLFSGSPLLVPNGLDVAPDGRIYVAAQISTTAMFDSGVIRIDPRVTPVLAEVVAVGDDEDDPIDRHDIISASDIAIEDPVGPVYVMDVRFRGSSLQNESRLLEVDLAGDPTSNQTLLTRGLEGIDRDQSSRNFRGLGIRGGVLFAIDYASNDTDGRVVRFVPGVDDGESSEGTGITEPEAFFFPSGLDVVTAPEPGVPPATSAALAALALLAATRRRNAHVPPRRGSTS